MKLNLKRRDNVCSTSKVNFDLNSDVNTLICRILSYIGWSLSQNFEIRGQNDNI